MQNGEARKKDSAAMKWDDLAAQPCSIARSLAVIGDRWTLMILRDCFLGVRRFEAFQARLGISRSIVTDRLRVLVEVEKIHLTPDLTFADFVRRMGAPERTVRRLINHRLGHDHFRAFLNACRVAEARRLLADPARAGDKLIAIALDSGFSSLASFNRAFKAVEGRPPSAFRALPTPEERPAVF